MRQGLVRIIGGQWRGRKIPVPDKPQLRPSLDRVRETLFNWLRPNIHDARCLDCFAGSGVIGFEALSQGAKSVTFIESDKALVDHLKQTSILLQAERHCEIIASDFFVWVKKQHFAEAYQMIFIDPPFAKNWLNDTVLALKQAGAINPQTQIYIEDDSTLPNIDGFELVKNAKAGAVSFGIIMEQA